jgi:hypothetical protein
VLLPDIGFARMMLIATWKTLLLSSYPTWKHRLTLSHNPPGVAARLMRVASCRMEVQNNMTFIGYSKRNTAVFCGIH